jgi:glycosyltransferase involved in cell wall biosynthesis
MFGADQSGGDVEWLALVSPGYVLQEQLEYATRIRGLRCDLVHLTANTAPLLRLGWPPTVVTVHDVMYLMSRSELALSPSLRQNLGRVYRRMAFISGTARVDHLIVDSEHTAREIARRVKKHPPLSVVHPAVDAAFFRDRTADLPSRLLAKYALDAGHYYLHPGAIDPRKNTRVVLSAFQRYRARGGRGELVVVGLSKAHRAVLYASDQAGVRLLPFVDNEDFLMILQLARAMIYVPSEEGFGYPLVEAMAAGVPAIISAIDVLDEMSGGCAWRVEPASIEALTDALLAFESHGQRARDLAVRGSVRAQQFTIRRMAEETLRAYEETRASAWRRRESSRTG